MGNQIIRQPDGRYAVWSSIVDSFTMVDATPDEIASEWASEESANIRRRVNAIVEELARGDKPYLQFTMTWDEALKKHRVVHGEPFDIEAVRAASGEE